VTARSNDNRRQRTIWGLVGDNAGPAPGPSTKFWAEDLAANATCLGNDFTYRLGDDSLESQFDNQLDNSASLDDSIDVVVTKILRNLNSVSLSLFWVVADFDIKFRTALSKPGTRTQTSISGNSCGVKGAVQPKPLRSVRVCAVTRLANGAQIVAAPACRSSGASTRHASGRPCIVRGVSCSRMPLYLRISWRYVSLACL
jgi:hypothetical protein